MRDTRIEYLIHLVEKSEIAKSRSTRDGVRITKRHTALAAPAAMPAVHSNRKRRGADHGRRARTGRRPRRRNTIR